MDSLPILTYSYVPILINSTVQILRFVIFKKVFYFCGFFNSYDELLVKERI